MTWPNWLSWSAGSLPLWSLLCSIGLWIRGCGWWAQAVIVTVCAVPLTGCGLPPVAPPGEPKMVLEACGRVRLAAFDEERGEFVDLGWHDAAGLRGWTIADYDWKP